MSVIAVHPVLSGLVVNRRRNPLSRCERGTYHSLCLFRIVWIQFALPLFAGIEGVLLVYPVSWAVGAVLMVLYAWKGKWMQLPEAIS